MSPGRWIDVNSRKLPAGMISSTAILHLTRNNCTKKSRQILRVGTVCSLVGHFYANTWHWILAKLHHLTTVSANHATDHYESDSELESDITDFERTTFPSSVPCFFVVTRQPLTNFALGGGSANLTSKTAINSFHRSTRMFLETQPKNLKLLSGSPVKVIFS